MKNISTFHMPNTRAELARVRQLITESDPFRETRTYISLQRWKEELETQLLENLSLHIKLDWH